jgi:hypothetical protein
MIALVAESVGNNDSVAAQDLVVPLSQSSADGNCLVACCAIRVDTVRTVESVTDDAGNVWQLGQAKWLGQGSAALVEVWFALNASPATTVTIRLTGSAAGVKQAANILEFSGVGVEMEGADSANGVGVTSLVSGSLTTTRDNSLLIAAINQSTTGGTRTFPAPGWTETQEFRTTGGSDVNGGAAFRVAPALETAEAEWATTGTVNYNGVIIALMPEEATGQTPGVPVMVKEDGYFGPGRLRLLDNDQWITPKVTVL